MILVLNVKTVDCPEEIKKSLNCVKSSELEMIILSILKILKGTQCVKQTQYPVFDDRSDAGTSS